MTYKAGDTYTHDGVKYILNDTVANALNSKFPLTSENLRGLDLADDSTSTASEILAGGDTEKAKAIEQSTRSNASIEGEAQHRYDNATSKEEATAITNEEPVKAAVQNRQGNTNAYIDAYNKLTDEQKKDKSNYKILVNAAKANELTEEQIEQAITDYQNGNWVPGPAGKKWIEKIIANRTTNSNNTNSTTTNNNKPQSTPSATTQDFFDGKADASQLSPEDREKALAELEEQKKKAEKIANKQKRREKIKNIAGLILDVVANTARGYDAGFHGREYSPQAFSSQLKSLIKEGDTRAEQAAKRRNYNEEIRTILPNATDADIEELYSYRNTQNVDLKPILEKKLKTNDPEYTRLLIEDPAKAEQYLNSAVERVKSANMINADKSTSLQNQKSTNELTQQMRDMFKDKAATIQLLQKQKTEWEKVKADASNMAATNAASILSAYRAVYDGTQTISSTASKASNANVSGNAGVALKGIVDLGIQGGKSWQDSVSNGSNTNAGALEGIAQGRARLNDRDIEAIKTNIIRQADEAIQSLDEAIEHVQTSQEFNMNDGVIKGKGIAQMLIRGDGSVIHFNPNDTIIATTNTPEGIDDMESFDAGQLDVQLTTKDPDDYLRRLSNVASRY